MQSTISFVEKEQRSVNVIEEWGISDMPDDPDEVKDQSHENPPNIYGYVPHPLWSGVIEMPDRLYNRVSERI